ncbi:MAG: hypothetical protein IIB63_12740, partial [Proteobacteria bacterium]|nr:hypothetical protein [Pseudomonadota bacterium]
SKVPLEPSPLLGADTEDVLRDDLKLEADAIVELRDAGVISSAASAPANT